MRSCGPWRVWGGFGIMVSTGIRPVDPSSSMPTRHTIGQTRDQAPYQLTGPQHETERVRTRVQPHNHVYTCIISLSPRVAGRPEANVDDNASNPLSFSNIQYGWFRKLLWTR